MCAVLCFRLNRGWFRVLWQHWQLGACRRFDNKATVAVANMAFSDWIKSLRLRADSSPNHPLPTLLKLSVACQVRGIQSQLKCMSAFIVDIKGTVTHDDNSAMQV